MLKEMGDVRVDIQSLFHGIMDDLRSQVCKVEYRIS